MEDATALVEDVQLSHIYLQRGGVLATTVCSHLSTLCIIVYDIWIQWHVVILSPIVLLFILPGFILILLYGTALFLHIYQHRRRQIYDAYATNFWEGAQSSVAAFYDAQATLWHGYEVHGLENIPDKGGALLIYYHGAVPIDVYYMMGRIRTVKKRNLRNVVAEFMFHIPGWKILMDVFGCVTGPIDECVNILQKGDLLAISPGGVREALFSDEHYKMIWNSRIGFAKVALKAQVPVIPVFTQNVRESFRTLKMGRRFSRWIYEKTKLPIVPIWGGFPVKLRTYFGKPITIDPSQKPEEIARCVHKAIKALIEEHQKLPGSILRGLKERFYDSSSKQI